jgi:hypothetical protein
MVTEHCGGGGTREHFADKCISLQLTRFPEEQSMRKISLLASIAAVPLLSMSVLPAPAQQLEEKSGSSMSQPQGGDGARDKSSAQGKTEQRLPNSGGEGAAKMSGSQDKTEGRASSASRDEHQTVGQDQTKDGESARDGKSPGADQSKADRAKANQGNNPKDLTKSAEQAKAKDQSKDQAKSRDQAKSKDQGQGQANAKGKDENQTGTNQSKGNGTQKQAPTTTGQAPRSNEPNSHNEQNRRNDPNTHEGQNGRDPQNNRDAQNGRSEQGGSQSRVDERGSVTLTDEQRTKIRETVLSGRDVPREDRLNFEIEVGRPVPREVRIREVPTTLVEIYPEWRGHEYFLVNDEIVIVDRSRRIVSHVPVGSASVETRRSSSESVEVTYSPEEIRRVQEVLIDKGFYKGRPDGVMSVEFKDALISFQRREGIEVSGRIDERTATSLGVSIRTEGQAGGREDGNRARDNDQKNGQNTPVNNDKPATSGQAGNTPNSGQNNPSSLGQDDHAKAPRSTNDPNQKSDNAPSGDTTRQPSQQRPSTSGQGGTSSYTNQDSPSQSGPSFRPTNPSIPSQPSGQGRDGASEQRKQP